MIKKQYFKKISFIFVANNEYDWMYSYASHPVAKHLHEDIFRIYFSSRDTMNRSCGAYLDIDINNPSKILNIANNPILNPGKAGLFDDCGAQICSYVKNQEKEFLYYAGWNIHQTIPFKTYLGLAICDTKDEKFVKKFEIPIIDRTVEEPLSIGWVNVIYHENKFKMWYEYNTKWECIDGNWEYFFDIRYAESDDGINFNRNLATCIASSTKERAVSRPSVLVDEDIYKMWYCYKVNEKYKIGYAESFDGLKWKRKDDLLIFDKSEEFWDSEELAYPYVFKHNNQIYMLCNGNHYGKTGFGIFKLERN
ncbi:hypothetical protein [Aliarcobacter cryaerophilus]